MSEHYTSPESIDQFLIDRPLQPKLAVAEYVRNYVPVPEASADIAFAEELIAEDAAVAARSDHPGEYGGPSGLGYTTIVLPGEDAMKNLLTAVRNPRHDRLREYAAQMGIDPDAYAKQASVSYWKYIHGINTKVVADNAIDGRYHIFGSYDGKHQSAQFGAIVEGDSFIVNSTSSDPNNPQMFKEHYSRLIERYEEVRRLPKFSLNHCPIMELQVSEDDNEIYFLQYHRGRDFTKGAKHLDPLDFDKREGWVQAETVRGLTSGQENYRMALGAAIGKYTLGIEDGYIDRAGMSLARTEQKARQQAAYIGIDGFRKTYSSMARDHGPTSMYFKPDVSMTMSPADSALAVPETLRYMADNESRLTGNVYGVEAEVVSGGRDAYVRFGKELIEV